MQCVCIGTYMHRRIIFLTTLHASLFIYLFPEVFTNICMAFNVIWWYPHYKIYSLHKYLSFLKNKYDVGKTSKIFRINCSSYIHHASIISSQLTSHLRLRSVPILHSLTIQCSPHYVQHSHNFHSAFIHHAFIIQIGKKSFPGIVNMRLMEIFENFAMAKGSQKSTPGELT